MSNFPIDNLTDDELAVITGALRAVSGYSELPLDSREALSKGARVFQEEIDRRFKKRISKKAEEIVDKYFDIAINIVKQDMMK